MNRLTNVHLRLNWIPFFVLKISRALLLVFITSGLVGCVDKPPMAEEEFEQILLEIQLSEAMIQSYPVDSQYIFRTGFIQDILLSHKISHEEYSAAYDYFSSDHESFQQMQERLKKKVSDAEKIEDLNIAY